MKVSAIALVVGFAVCAGASASDSTRTAVKQSAKISVPAAKKAKASRQQESSLTKGQETLVLDLIDDICADTWCEGDYDYNFSKFTCDESAGTCTLRFFMWPFYDKPARVQGKEFSGDYVARSAKATCAVRAKYSEIIESQGSYKQLNDGFYNQIDACINAIEAKLAPKTILMQTTP